MLLYNTVNLKLSFIRHQKFKVTTNNLKEQRKMILKVIYKNLRE